MLCKSQKNKICLTGRKSLKAMAYDLTRVKLQQDYFLYKIK